MPEQTAPAKKKGRPPFLATKEQRIVVTAMVAGGTEQKWVAEYLHINISTLKRHFKSELRNGVGVVGARLNATAIQKALSGDKTLLIFALKTRFGWSETNRHQFVGKDGNPISFDSLDDNSIDQLMSALRASLHADEARGDSEHAGELRRSGNEDMGS